MSATNRVSRVFATEGAAVFVVFIAMVIVFAVASPVFLTGGNIDDLLVEAVFIVLLAAGMTFVLVVGGIDLSVGSVLGLSAGTSLWALMSGSGTVLAVLAGVGTGLAAGLVNGVMIAVLGVNDFIVTLAMLSVGAGLLQVLTANVSLTGAHDAAFAWLDNGSFLGIPAPVLIAAVIVLVLEFVLVSTPFGRYVYAAGIGPRAAALAGVPVRRVRLQVYVLSGGCAGAGGVLLASKLNSVQSGLGAGYELTAIAAAVLGGVSLAGGRGSVWRAVLGAVFLGTLSQGLQLLGVDPLWFTIVTGLSIVAAVALDRLVSRIATSRLLGTGDDPREDGPPPREEQVSRTAVDTLTTTGRGAAA
ncbi:ABC transporter permease [uncultured Jatrophihabitans sp.]|uniref:ABC transporter permease n=1 Tax=uncultured Jatrophihabitans sp. TaxID=1610747 RepID=UPI0035C98D62